MYQRSCVGVPMTSVTLIQGSVWTERRVEMGTPMVWGLGEKDKDVELVGMD